MQKFWVSPQSPSKDQTLIATLI